MKSIKLIVKTKNSSYPIIIGSNLLNKIPNILFRSAIKFEKCLLVIDNRVPIKFINKIVKSLDNKKIIIHKFNSNELNKNQLNVNRILNKLLKNNFHRNDAVISVGGGITGDVSGFVSSIYKRGLKFINIPTTLLAQVDSSIGGKTGINSSHGKNLIGSFYQPNLVVSDIDFLRTLPKRELICGYGEIFKHSLIANKKFFYYLDKNGKQILNLKSPFIEKSIYQSCLIKKKIIQIDEGEKNIRKILNFGHTFAHAYEATLKYSKKLNHGEAVLLGVMSASKFSFENKLIAKKEFDLIEDHLLKLKLPNNLKKFFSLKDLKKLIYFMQKDKKNISAKINLVLLEKIAKPIYNLTFNKKKLRIFLKKELLN